MKISIAMATYNGEAYLQEQLDSFIRQTRQPDQLVVSDDGSTDGTLEILETFCSVAPFEVRILKNQENLGYAGNFNRALQETSGQLVFLSDQDDVWFPEKIKIMVQMADANIDDKVFMNDCELTDEQLNSLNITKLDQIQAGGFDDSTFIIGCCAMIRRDFLELILPVPEGLSAHDRWVVGLANDLGLRQINSDVLQYYRRHGSNQSEAITNNTVRLSPYVIWKAIKSGKNESSPDAKVITALKQYDILISSSECLKSKFPQMFQFKLNKMIEEKRAQRDIMKIRLSTRNQNLIKRFFGIFRLLVSGKYRYFSGIRSALRDLVG